MKAAFAAMMAGFLLFTASGCSVTINDGTVTIDDNPPLMVYYQISQQEAKNIIDSGENAIILDVRRQDEYNAGHIPDAILIPNENIHHDPPAELPDKEQKILIYCRSGNRSKQAAQKLADMGYTNVYEFGGITTWPYDIVTEADAESQAAPITSSSMLSSASDIGIYDTDGQDYHYIFTYNNEEYNAYYTPDNWCILNSYKIIDKNDIEIICQALADIHPIHSADMTDWRTPQDMAYEWSQHNIAYSLLSDDSEWKESAKDVDIDPPDQGKSVYQLFKDRISSE